MLSLQNMVCILQHISILTSDISSAHNLMWQVAPVLDSEKLVSSFYYSSHLPSTHLYA